jgi:gas vesicle protein
MEINSSLKEEPAMYEPHYEEEAGGGGFLIGLLCGTALGAAIGLMFAPKAGSEFRQRLYESTGDIRRKATETYDQASEQVNNMVSKGRQAVDRGREAFESARQSAASQSSGGNGTTSDFGTNQGRSGVSDFNSSARTTGGA